ncbi:hypothetical protein MCOR02_002052 [Pyricularia oryzae]|uniref:Uncharacterized protein n=2 Tax=Pyricularia oryzae TaxID=318829 RepID=G4MY37_PYRO7|nr:uncharacterized protein MGG_15657 [Pyricularia oryzae 70-15]KAH9438425.1 hypothetical protein MCOR02_002052 [Pyricularia oryzae]EHA54368.1 hypothetical protein MGG_15657 [Pyricularia oryzae 70-15]KAI7920441.1 hypothetical protein M9X92_005866 [Pyricularia oryzae]KAI7924806.1 hypothetical protein M0657_004429 [Pyricularia oryzae]QBZ56023.1 hypothetical protein PoMZ_00929 [Pyricularia oryzae]
MDNTICEITLLLEAFILGLNRVCARVGLVQANANSEPGGQLDHFSLDERKYDDPTAEKNKINTSRSVTNKQNLSQVHTGVNL